MSPPNLIKVVGDIHLGGGGGWLCGGYVHERHHYEQYEWRSGCHSKGE